MGRLSTWLLENETYLKNQDLCATYDKKVEQLTEFRKKRKEIIENEETIDAVIQKSHFIMQTCEAEDLKLAISQLSNR